MSAPTKRVMLQIRSTARTGFVAAIITLLIWFAADRNVTEEETFEFQVRLKSSDPQRYVSFAEPPFQKTISFTASGVRSRLREFRELLLIQPVFVVDIAKSTGVRPQELSTGDDILRRIKEVRNARLSISNIQPKSFLARIDRYETIHGVRVQPEYGGLKVVAEMTPSEVSVKLPRFIARQLSSNPIAKASAESLIRATANNGSFQIQAPLTLDGIKDVDPNINIEFIPDRQVTIRGRIEALTEVQSKGPVQITWSIPDVVQKQYIVKADDSNLRVYIDVQGPKNRLNQLDPADIRGLVEVLAGDMDDPGPGAEITRKVQFFFPPEFPDCALAPNSQQFEVRFQLQPRSQAAPTELSSPSKE